VINAFLDVFIAKSVNMNMDCVGTLFPWLACGVLVLLQILSKQAVVH
jgi:hypothetical protein